MSIRMPKSMISMIAAALILICGVDHAQGDDPLAPYIGQYKLTTPPAVAAKSIENAIAASTEDMNIVKRKAARVRLPKAHFPFPSINIAREGDFALITLADRVFKSKLNGPDVPGKGPDGEAFMLSQNLSDGKLVQQFKTEKGKRINTYSIGDKGNLTLSVKVSGPDLPKPIQYKLRYKK